MACPYCGSGDWGYEALGDGSPEVVTVGNGFATIRFTCECWECGRLFYNDEEFRDMDSYEPKTLEEGDRDE